MYPPRLSETGPTPSFPRGPPRKPKQSGHALWVGNLPPGTSVLDLKDHFSRDATKDIESLFLISKSNCAIVNYRTEATSSASMTRFHDSRFHGVRLVCRLRRQSGLNTQGLVPDETIESSAYEHSLSGDTTDATPSASVSESSPIKEEAQESVMLKGTGPTGERVPEKYFIVKSLTMQDLDASVRNGVWATQSHNEAILNKGFEVCEK